MLQTEWLMVEILHRLQYFNPSSPGLKVTNAWLKRNTWGQQLLSLWQESIQQGQSKLMTKQLMIKSEKLKLMGNPPPQNNKNNPKIQLQLCTNRPCSDRPERGSRTSTLTQMMSDLLGPQWADWRSGLQSHFEEVGKELVGTIILKMLEIFTDTHPVY